MIHTAWQTHADYYAWCEWMNPRHSPPWALFMSAAFLKHVEKPRIPANPQINYDFPTLSVETGTTYSDGKQKWYQTPTSFSKIGVNVVGLDTEAQSSLHLSPSWPSLRLYFLKVPIVNSSVDDWHLYCLSVSLRWAGLERATHHRALVPPHHLKSWLIECGLVVPSNNNTIDFALRGQAMTSKTPSFVWLTKLKITLQAHPLICCSVDWTGPGGQEEM